MTVVNLDDFRNKPDTDIDPLDQPMDQREQNMFAMDTVADQWANDLVHAMMMEFSRQGTDIDFDDPIYGKLMEAAGDIARSMTRHHLNVFDETALMLQKYPNGEIMPVGVMTSDEDMNDGV